MTRKRDPRVVDMERGPDGVYIERVKAPGAKRRRGPPAPRASVAGVSGAGELAAAASILGPLDPILRPPPRDVIDRIGRWAGDTARGALDPLIDLINGIKGAPKWIAVGAAAYWLAPAVVQGVVAGRIARKRRRR